MRLFAAADLPPEVRAGLPTTLSPEKLHVTLVFIGDRPEAPAFDLVPPAAPLRVNGRAIELGRVLAAELEDPSGAWTAYQARLAAALGVVETRPWRPHVTLARRRRDGLGAVAPCEFIPGSVTLYRSAEGRYEPLEHLLAHI